MLSTALLAAVLGVKLPGDGLIDYDTRWRYPHYLNRRPGDGQVVDTNPPRMSWPYLQGTVVENHPPQRLFTLQIADNEACTDPVVEVVDTPCNFYNALPVLDEGTWYWRVGYRLPDEDRVRWSDPWGFEIGPDAVEWDRAIITRAHKVLAGRPHPRIGPADGDWQALRAALEADPMGAEYLEDTLRMAEALPRQDWWTDFPQSDVKEETGLAGRDWIKITRNLARAAMAYRLSGDERLLPAKEHILTVAGYPRGGQTSPEYHAKVRKWPTQVTQHLAVAYDLWYPELTEAEREQMREAIAWRLEATYLQAKSWMRKGGRADWRGVAVFAASHPFENFVWTLPAVLLTAGDLEVADRLTPVVLHFLTGVTASHGPDEGWNEGLAYGGWKGHSMLQAALATHLLLPELGLSRSPYFPRLGEWYAHIYPIGIQRLSFGDYAQAPEGKRGTQLNVLKFIAFLSGDSRATHRYEALAQELGNRTSGYPWWDVVAAAELEMPSPEPYSPDAVFPEAGWVMASTHPPSLREDFQEAVGMIFKCRPRGGHSHSFRSEGDFVWYGYGQTLSVGAGGPYPDPYSRHSMSHNVLLINGEGQEWNPREPSYPYMGRLLAYEKGDGYTWWVGDATHAYQTVDGLKRWLRHVVFVDERWFVIFDDLAMEADAEPAKFSWLLHIAQNVDLEMSGGDLRWSHDDGVNARVAFAEPEGVDIVDLQGRDGYRNLVTGEDIWETARERLGAKGREIREDRLLAHNIWVTNREPAVEHTFLAALTAWPEGAQAPEVGFNGERVVTITGADGEAQTVSFDPSVEADITVDIAAVRAHMMATEPR